MMGFLEASDSWCGGWFDFVLCQRADGTFYGTYGTCRKGREVPPHELLKLAGKGRKLGEGVFGVAYDLGNGVVLKQGRIKPKEVQALKDLKSVEGVPRLITENISQQGNIMVMSKAPGVLVKDLPPKQQAKAWDKTILLLKKIHKAGYAHNDLHGGNVMYNPKTGKVTVLDFGIAKTGPGSSINELIFIPIDFPDLVRQGGPLTKKFWVKIDNTKQKTQDNFLNFPASKKDAARQKWLDEFWSDFSNS